MCSEGAWHVPPGKRGRRKEGREETEKREGWGRGKEKKKERKRDTLCSLALFEVRKNPYRGSGISPGPLQHPPPARSLRSLPRLGHGSSPPPPPIMKQIDTYDANKLLLCRTEIGVHLALCILYLGSDASAKQGRRSTGAPPPPPRIFKMQFSVNFCFVIFGKTT